MQLRGGGISSCMALASALSAKYATYQEFSHYHDSLPEYLDQNGIVVSMCTGVRWFPRPELYGCFLPHRDRILSASWIQENQTGFRVFVPGELVAEIMNVGMVLDPTALDPQCLFPADAMTVGRDDLHYYYNITNDNQQRQQQEEAVVVVASTTAKACGPVKDDPRYGSKGYDDLPKWKQWIKRYGWDAYSWKEFGGNHSVSCAEFFGLVDDDEFIPLIPQLYVHETITTKSDDKCFDNWIFQDYIQYMTESVEYEVGHKLCKDTDPPPQFDETNWLIYTGRCSYRPDQFHEMLMSMQQLDELHPRVQNWNEIVFDRPTKKLNDVVQAVFFLESYVEDDDDDKVQAYQHARHEAKRLGKHLFNVQNFSSGQPLFTCNESAVDLLASG